MDSQSILVIALIAPVLLLSVIAHEVAHGYAALAQGDTTARDRGRLSLNPLRHIDPLMTIVLPLVLLKLHLPVFGGAKPVPVDPRNYRRLKQGDIIVSLAGVATNLALALVFTVVVALLGVLGRAIPSLGAALAVAQAMLGVGVTINIELLFFNLLPIPPLDGSHVMKYLLPPAWAVQYQRVGFFGIFILLLLLSTPLVYYWLTPGFMLANSLLSAVRSLLLPGADIWMCKTGICPPS